MSTVTPSLPSPPQLSAQDRVSILDKTLSALEKKFYKPEALNDEWRATVARHKPMIEASNDAGTFEKNVSELLTTLKTSHVGFFHGSARRASSRAALSATYLEDDTPFGKRWIFQDVHPGGAASNSGIRAGDVLQTVNGDEIVPPEHPVFAMGQKTSAQIIGSDNQVRTVELDVSRPKGKKLQFVEPTLVVIRKFGDDVGYLKVPMFPGMVGVEVSNEISQGIAELGDIDRLIIDLRGNTGGGIGALRIMSLLTAEKLPVGFALDKKRVTSNLDSEKAGFPRFDTIPTSKNSVWRLAIKYAPSLLMSKPVVLQTEGLGSRKYHGNIVLLVDRHTASAAEMIVAFAKENNLARIVGEPTAGRLLSATSVKVGHGYRLALPTGAYYTWRGSVLEGTPINPDEAVPFDWRLAREKKDSQLDFALDLITSHHRSAAR